jgi:hypothetical protein
MSTPYMTCDLANLSDTDLFRLMVYQNAEGQVGLGIINLTPADMFPRETITANLTAGVDATLTFNLGLEARIIQMYDDTDEQVTPDLFRPNGVDSLIVRVSVTGTYVINVIGW